MLVGKVRNKFISILLLAVLLVGMIPAGSFAATSYSKGENIKVEPDATVKVEEFLQQMNKEMADIYGIDTNELNFPVSTKFGKAKIYKITGIIGGEEKDFGYTFAYGEPYGYENGIPRYLGRARYSTDDPNDGFTNIGFPYDAYGGWTFPDLLPGSKYGSTFIEKPWEHPELIGKRLNGGIDRVFYDNPTAKGKLREQIDLGIKLVHPELVGDPEKFSQIPWEKYVHIYQPPTYSAWGMGVIWHKRPGGNPWYKTIPIAPYKLVEEAKYGIITLGFLDDGKVGTIDILESVDSKNQERLLKTISEDVVVQLSSFWEQFYRYMVSNYGKDPYNASDEEFDNVFDEFYNSYSEKDALATAYSDVYRYQSTTSNRPKERE